MIRTVMSSGQANKASSVILRKDDNASVDTLEAMLVSCSSSVLQGSRSRVGLEEVVLGKVQKRQLYASAETSEEFREDDIMVDESFVHQAEKKRRLNADQVKFLERSFEAENKLEPDRKLQLAKDLSLQPRQVAVWFQNRRARWKTKQLEKDYEALKANFDKLRVDYDALLKEKNQLRDKVEGLTCKMKEEIKQEQRDSLICGVSVDDPEDTKEPPEKIDRCETPVSTRNSHARIKVIPEHITEVKKEGSTSSGSDESAVVDINSPYTIESRISTVEAGVSYSAVPFLKADDPPDLAILAGIPSKVLPPQAFQQFTKTESGLFEDQSCFFPVDEQGTFSWWSWP